MWSHGPSDWFPWMWIFPLIFLVVMVLFLLRGPGWPMWGRHGMREREDSARAILDRRYARGEISQEEYHRIRKDLE